MDVDSSSDLADRVCEIAERIAWCTMAAEVWRPQPR